MRAVVDTNVFVSALLSPSGPPAGVVRSWIGGGFDLIVSPELLDELERALAYRKVRRYVSESEAEEFIELLHRRAEVVGDPDEPPTITSSDRGDDFVIALAATANAAIVSGDRHLLDLTEQIPVYAPADFLAIIEAGDR